MLVRRCYARAVRHFSRAEIARLGFTDEEWGVVTSLINDGKSEDAAVRYVYARKVAEGIGGEGMDGQMAVGLGHKDPTVMRLVSKYRGVLEKTRGAKMSPLWAFPETEVDVSAYEKASAEEQQQAMLYLANDIDGAKGRWGVYCRIEPDMPLLNENADFQEAYAEVYELRRELAKAWPDPRVYDPVVHGLAEERLNNHPKQVRYLAHLVAFHKRSVREKARAAQLAQARHLPTEERRRLLFPDTS
eukprot:TRINITY_DN22271_c0_g1_i1.p1 TRINITY_DN22271_c0_g1~~TRINITY_DN22271_c0_g1_i1.p1  ORF type:complete len:245 (+),score=61.61 TRINITY_DN22271_c0_g1_i1:70-804(+)